MSVLDEWDLVIIARNGSTCVMSPGFVLRARAVPADVERHRDVGVQGRGVGAPVARRDRVQAAFTSLTIINKNVLYEKIRAARVDGYVEIEQQLQIGVRGVAVPMKNRHGEVVAALSANMPIGKETSEAALARVLQPLQETALAMLNAI